MKNIIKIDIGLNNNNVTAQGAFKIGKVLGKIQFVTDLSLNLNNNNIKS